MSLQSYPLIGDWITVQNGRLLIHSGKVDIGQRISTALIQIAHEELTIPSDLIDIAPVRTGHAPDEGITSGSNSIEQSGHAIRCAAITLREHLLGQAVAQHGGDVTEWRIDNGVLQRIATNHSIDMLDFIPAISADTLVNPDGVSLARTDSAPPCPKARGLSDMVRGAYEYIHDLERPGMLHSRIVRAPHAGASLEHIDTETLTNLETVGFSIIRDGSFLAVAGPQEWPVIKAALKLATACKWSALNGLAEDDVFAKLTAKNAQRFLVLDATPTEHPIPEPDENPNYTARFERAYQMHGSLAPSAALAEWRDYVLNVHCHSQGIYPLRDSIADSLGLAQNQVDITHGPGSGCYGHNGADDAAFEACLIAMALPDTPVLLKWSREDEHSWEPYAPAMAVDVAAHVTDGKITSYSADVFSDTHRGRPRSGPNRAGPARLLSNHMRVAPIGPIAAQPNLGQHAGMHRNLDPIYTFDKTRLVKNLVPDLVHRTSAMRCLGAVANIFALESVMDDFARNQDVAPIKFRKTHLDDPRGLAVLAELERQIEMKQTSVEGHGYGVGYAQYKNRMTRVGVWVDLVVNDRAEIRLKDAIIVADAGRIIDADGLSAQLEGGFLQAASWAIYEQVKWDRDGIQSRDWDSYPVLRFDNVPNIDVTLLDQPNSPSVGAGEASPGPTIAAIANAVYDATGLHMRRMPFDPETIMRVAAAE